MPSGICWIRFSAIFVALAAIAAVALFGGLSVAAPANKPHSVSASADAAKVVAALDTEFQRAVKNNDAAAIDRILADNFVLVTGRGQAQDKAEQLREARDRSATYEHQEDTNRTVRVWGNTAVVTALLWAKGSENGKPFDVKLWFSDVYVRTSKGWRYVFGQASLPLPAMR
jgi:ketosteroid isomerase-like protein